jgi:hypothetical protein
MSDFRRNKARVPSWHSAFPFQIDDSRPSVDVVDKAGLLTLGGESRTAKESTPQSVARAVERVTAKSNVDST